MPLNKETKPKVFLFYNQLTGHGESKDLLYFILNDPNLSLSFQMLVVRFFST